MVDDTVTGNGAAQPSASASSSTSSSHPAISHPLALVGNVRDCVNVLAKFLSHGDRMGSLALLLAFPLGVPECTMDRSQDCR